MSERFYWKTIECPIPAHPHDVDGYEWAWRLENEAGDVHTLYCGVSGSVGDGSPSASVWALVSEGASEAAKACTMKHPPRKVVLGTRGYLEGHCAWDGPERPDRFRLHHARPARLGRARRAGMTKSHSCGSSGSCERAATRLRPTALRSWRRP